jgi:hypothetical protein
MKFINRFEQSLRGWQIAVRSFLAVFLLYSIGASMFTGNAIAASSYPDPTRVLVAYKINDVDTNGNGIGDSLELAQYYAAKRNVPQANLLGVNISVSSNFYYTGQYGLFYSDMVAPASVSLPLNIGRYYESSGYGWDGVIDEVRLYNRTLTSTEISAIYNYTGMSTTPPTLPGM